jgi:16S rRNA (guanine527-N7)-methyltransferase
VPLRPCELRALEAGAAGLGVPLSPEAARRIAAYVDELRRWLSRVNLVSRGDADALVERHVLDSLAAAPLLADTPETAWIADVGSGAGLPGIPLAVVLAPRRIVLIEPRRKRASFLRAAARRAGPLAIEVRESRVEELAAGDLQGALAATVSRAALATAAYLAAVRPLLVPGGTALAFRSAADASNERPQPGFEAPEIHPYEIFGRKRATCLVRWRRSDELAQSP